MPDSVLDIRFWDMPNPVSFRYFKTSLLFIQLVVMLYVRFLLSLRNVEDLLPERGVHISHGSLRYWWNRLRPGLKFKTDVV